MNRQTTHRGDVRADQLRDQDVRDDVTYERDGAAHAMRDRAEPQTWRSPERGPQAVAPARSPGSLLASTPSFMVLIASVWLIVSRFALNFGPGARGGSDAFWNGVIIGIAAAFVAAVRMSNPNSNPALSLAVAAFGGWMIASPWVYGYNHWGSGGGRLAWNDLGVGIFIAALALIDFFAGTGMQAMQRRRARSRTA